MVKARLTPREVITAGTRNSARGSINLAWWSLAIVTPTFLCSTRIH